MFWAFTGLALISTLVYAYSLIATVHITADRQRLTKELSQLSSKVGDLEFKTIALRNQFDLNTALAEGYVEVKAPTFISRTSDTLTLNVGRR